jgi:DDE superfamily endonuclease
VRSGPTPHHRRHRTPTATAEKPGKQALPCSGKKEAHTDKDVVIVTLPRERVDFLSQTCVGKTHDKEIADPEGITYPPEAILSQDTGFQGSNPVVTETHQAKKSRPAEDSPLLRSERTESWHAPESQWSTHFRG